MTSRHYAWAVAFALSLVTAAQAEDAGIVITISGGKFTPTEVSVPVNKKVKLIVRNHDTSMAEFESVALHREKTVAPGQEISLFVGPLEAGNYEFFDDFHPQNRGHLVAK
jgi:heme/copper-type cytochrome/quinol oxidase subunit 2